jgi:hypothetical protein
MLTVCLDTPTARASSACDSSLAIRARFILWQILKNNIRYGAEQKMFGCGGCNFAKNMIQ